MQTVKRYVKYILACGLAALLAAAAGCGQQSPGIAFFVYDENDTFISEMMEQLMAQLPADTAAEIHDAGNSQAVQNQQIVGMLEGETPLFVINTVDRLACSSIVEKCTGEDVNIIFFNREPLGDAMRAEDVYYVGSAADSLGKKQADMVAALFGDDYSESPYDKNSDGVVQVAILKGEQGHQDAEKRTDNCVSRLIELGYEVDVLAIEVADWNKMDGYDAMRRLYSLYGRDIELVFSNNDDMALGAIEYLLDAGIFLEGAAVEYQPVVIVGVDGTTVGLEAVAKNLLYGTVHNDSARQSDAILVLADYLLSEKDMTEFPYEITNSHYIYIDGDIITKHNVQDYM